MKYSVIASIQISLYTIASLTDGCSDGDVRLLDGVIEQEGRPEVCVDGVWGSICDDNWSIDDAHVMCLSLGYTGSASTILYMF